MKTGKDRIKPKLQVLDQNIATYTKGNIEYICITDIARYKNSARTDDLVRNWLRNRNTIEFFIRRQLPWPVGVN